MSTLQSALRLGPGDRGRSLNGEEFAAAEYVEPWRYERADGRLIVMPPDGPDHDASSEPLRDHLGVYRLAHPDRVDQVVSEAWVRIDGGTDRIADIGVYLNGPRSAIERPDRVPELIFEIVSPDRESRERDYVLKRKEYQRLDVLEYAIIDRMRGRVTIYTAGPRGYGKRVLHTGGIYASWLLPGLAIPLDGIL